jgi:hypothetical protein
VSETKVTSQTGNQVQMPQPPNPVINANRASKPGLPYTGAPGHKMPR